MDETKIALMFQGMSATIIIPASPMVRAKVFLETEKLLYTFFKY
tara:strand:+ start:308 stop:439 length:132 start_codon:yes stop_codon:yes gene_type:complete